MFWKKKSENDLSTLGQRVSRTGEPEKAPAGRKHRSWGFGSKNVNGGISEGEKSGVEEERTDPLQQLPDHEREILERQIHVPEAPVNYISLYRYASRRDLAIIIFGGICAIVGGALLPMFTVSYNIAQLLPAYLNF